MVNRQLGRWFSAVKIPLAVISVDALLLFHPFVYRVTPPHVPVILYIGGGGGLLERREACQPDCISIDQSVDMLDGIKRIGTGFAVQVSCFCV